MMPDWNLTKQQKQLLKWIVEQENSENIQENYIEFKRVNSRLLVIYPQKSSKIPDGAMCANFNALIDNGYLKSTSANRKDTYIPTAKAYKAVYSNFDEPNLSAVPRLIPLTEVKHLDSELWKRCRYSLSSGGDDPKAWDKAVRTAVVILEERLRKLGNTESMNADATGEAIVNLIFAGKDPFLKGKLDDKKLKAYRDLYAGMMSVFRNPYAHRIQDPTPEVGGAIIVFIDLLLKMLDDIDWD